MADDPDPTAVIAARLAHHRAAYLAAYFAGHDAEAEHHVRAVDELLHIGDHYGRNLTHVLDDLARWQA